MAAVWLSLLSIYMPVLLLGCDTRAYYDDLDIQMATFRHNAKSTVESLPVAPQIVRSNYTALTMRSPFLRPADAVGRDQLSNTVALAPDQGRSREPLSFLITVFCRWLVR